MSVIQIDHLTFGYPGGAEEVFEDLSLQLDTGWKLGLVGRNGRGKTTLLRLLMGELEYRGRIRSPARFCYFPAPVPDPSRPVEEVLSGLCPASEGWEVERELSLLGLEEGALERPFATLSQGEQTKVLLAALFLEPRRVPLIDEPTNHLDARGRAQVAAYLRRKPGFILVSHDRRFLDGCVDHILALNRTGAEVQSGTCSSWLANFEGRQAFEAAQAEKLQKEMARLRGAARQAAARSDRTGAAKYGNGPVDRGFVGHKSAKLMRRAKQIEQRRLRAAEEKEGLLRDRETAPPLKLEGLDYPRQVLVSCEGVQVWYGGWAACPPVSFTLGRGERLALDGGNGSGKSSLLKLLGGAALDHTGRLALGNGLVVSQVPQDTEGLRGLPGDFARESGVDLSRFFTILRKLDFQRALFERDMAGYSAGQRKVEAHHGLCGARRRLPGGGGHPDAGLVKEKGSGDCRGSCDSPRFCHPERQRRIFFWYLSRQKAALSSLGAQNITLFGSSPAQRKSRGLTP